MSLARSATHVPFLVLVGLIVAFVSVSAPGAGAVELDEVVSIFAEGVHVYVEPGAEQVDINVINAAVDRAAAADIDLYVAVLANGSDRVDANLVRDALGESTVAVFTPGLYRLATSMSDLCVEAFNTATAQAGSSLVQESADAAISAFVDAALLQPECEASSGLFGINPLWWLLLAALTLGAIAWLVSQALARNRKATRDAADFEQRRLVLHEWAGSLREPLTRLNAPVQSSGSSALTRMYNDAVQIARESDGDIHSATKLPDLDRVEIRIARAQMQIRDMQIALAGGPTDTASRNAAFNTAGTAALSSGRAAAGSSANQAAGAQRGPTGLPPANSVFPADLARSESIPGTEGGSLPPHW